VTENLRQATAVIGVVDNKLMTRIVPKEVRIESEFRPSVAVPRHVTVLPLGKIIACPRVRVPFTPVAPSRFGLVTHWRKG